MPSSNDAIPSAESADARIRKPSTPAGRLSTERGAADTSWLARLPTVPRSVVWGLVILSLLSILLSPLESTVDRLVDVAPWVALALLVTEILFVAGLALMASLVGIGIGWNPLKWSDRFDDTVSQVSASPMFWLGFIVNTIGGVGSAVVLAVGIFAGLPVQSWGLLILPFLDLVLTAAVRAAVLSRVRRPARESP